MFTIRQNKIRSKSTCIFPDVLSIYHGTLVLHSFTLRIFRDSPIILSNPGSMNPYQLCPKPLCNVRSPLLEYFIHLERRFTDSRQSPNPNRTFSLGGSLGIQNRDDAFPPGNESPLREKRTHPRRSATGRYLDYQIYHGITSLSLSFSFDSLLLQVKANRQLSLAGRRVQFLECT